jgi:hypothetical protein
VSQGAILLPPFDAHIFSYRTSVAEYVSAIRITAYLPADSKVCHVGVVYTKQICSSSAALQDFVILGLKPTVL